MCKGSGELFKVDFIVLVCSVAYRLIITSSAIVLMALIQVGGILFAIINNKRACLPCGGGGQARHDGHCCS